MRSRAKRTTSVSILLVQDCVTGVYSSYPYLGFSSRTDSLPHRLQHDELRQGDQVVVPCREPRHRFLLRRKHRSSRGGARAHVPTKVQVCDFDASLRKSIRKSVKMSSFCCARTPTFRSPTWMKSLVPGVVTPSCTRFSLMATPKSTSQGNAGPSSV